MRYASWGLTFLGTPQKPRQLKEPGPKLTIKQLKEARKGNGSPCKGNRWPRKGNGQPPATGTEGLLIVEMPFNCCGSSHALIVGARAELLRNGQTLAHQNRTIAAD